MINSNKNQPKLYEYHFFKKSLFLIQMNSKLINDNNKKHIVLSNISLNRRKFRKNWNSFNFKSDPESDPDPLFPVRDPDPHQNEVDLQH